MKKGHPSKNPFPPPKGKAAPVAEPSSDDEEDSDVEADGDLSDAASWTTEQIMESCTVTRSYLKDPLKAFLSNPEISLSNERLNGLYAARAVVAKEIDPLLGPKGPFAEEFRSIERQRLSSMKERLFTLRRNLSRKEVKALDPSELKLEGTGLMWATGLHNVSESVRHGTTIPIEFTELDEDIFNHCIDVETGFIDNDPFKGMQYTFFFAANPYFSNTELRCSLHFASAYLSLERFGVEPSFISAVTSDTPVQWLNKGQFESLPEEDVNPHERKLRDTLVSVFLGEDLPASVANDVKTLMMMWPRPLFTLLFNTNTSVDAKSALQNALFNTTTASGKTVFDDTPGGPASIKAAALEMSPLVKLWRALEATVRAPMINILDSQKDVLDADDYGDDEEEEEESDDDSDESDDSDVKHKAKQHRAENPTKKPPPPDCKQQ